MDFNNTGAMKSPFSPRVRQSIAGRRPIGLSSSKKNQSMYTQSTNEQAGDVIYKTPMITVETYGLPLPVMVTEALTFGNADVSVRMSECGWCWVVTGRRILAWPHSVSANDSSASLQAGSLAARELTLPQTDLAHKADLVMLFYLNDAQMPSCVGVSPEGVVRFWASVGQEGAYCDVTCELAGQECARLAAARGALLLATTTCSLVLLTPALAAGRAAVACRTLRPPSGWLGGLGRRVSHMFFGSMPAHAEPRLVGAVVAGGAEPLLALVARGPLLQLWRGAELHEHSLRRALAEDHLLLPHGEAGNAEITALDVRAAGAELLLLLLAVAAPRAPERRYAIAHICIANPERPAVRLVAALRGGWPDADEPPRLLPLDQHALLYTSAYVALAPSMMSSDKVEYISVGAEGDRILGAELCGGRPLLFSRKHGVLLLAVTEALAPAALGGGSPRASPCPSDAYDGSLALFEVDPHEVSAVTADACGKLKAAFLFHVRRDEAACRALLHELFPRADAADVDAPAARTALAVAAALLDDAPAGDPRWRARAGPATSVALGASAALHIAAQLADKRRAFALFVDFLRATALLPRAGSVTAEGGGAVSAEAALAALAERLAAAAALRAAHTAPQGPAHLIDAAIEAAVGGAPDEEPEVAAALAAGALSPADVCYRRVTRIPRVLAALARAPAPPHPPAAAAEHARGTIVLLTGVLAEMHKCRSQWGCAPPPELGPRALLPALLELVKRAVSRVARACEGAARAALQDAAAALAAAALHDAAPLRDDPRSAHLYERMRRDVILPFLEEGQTERAAALADKFQDLELLVELCMRLRDLPRLHHYIDKYDAQGMAAVAYSRLAASGGAGAAALVRGVRGGARLAAWLAAAPERRPLAALRALAHGDPAAAADAFADIAAAETDSVGRMTTAASLAKLCAEAAPEGAAAAAAAGRRADRCLLLAEQHAALPPALRPPRDNVMTPEELVQLYVSQAARGAALSEYDYKQALELAGAARDAERRDDLRLRVWCACIKRDSWSVPEPGADGPEPGAGGPEPGAAHVSGNMFYRLMDLVHVMGGDLALLLPAPEDILTARELAELAAQPAFHSAVRYGYRCLHTARD